LVGRFKASASQTAQKTKKQSIGKQSTILTQEKIMTDPIRVVALAGSLSDNSKTRMALEVSLQGAQMKGAQTRLIDLRDFELIFADGDDNSLTPDVFKLRQIIQTAEGVILGTPEYHGGYSGVLKNALDLMGFKEFQGKIIGLVGVAGGSTGAINSLTGLRTVCRSLRAWVVPNQVSVPRAWQVFNDDGTLNDEQLQKRLIELGQEVTRFAYLHNSAQAAEFLANWETAYDNPGGE
jgi:NAD(P)H-dependent FMN reductase